MFTLLTDVILDICTWLCFPDRTSVALDGSPIPPSPVLVEEEPGALTSIHGPAVAAEETPVLSKCSRENDVPGVSLTAEESETAGTRIREGDERGTHTDGENVTYPEQQSLPSTEYPRQADRLGLPALAGHEACNTQPLENKHSADGREVPTMLTKVVPVNEGSPMIANGCSQGRDSQELLLRTGEDPVSIRLRGNEDCDGELEAQASSEEDETDSEEDELHTSWSVIVDRGRDELELSARAGDQAAIAHIHEIGPSAGVAEETVSADEKLRVLSCRCSEPMREEELRLPEDKWENVITCLLRNKYNCSVETAQAQLEEDEKERARRWEEAAGKAGVELEQRRVGVVYADEKAMDDVKVEIPRQLKYVGTRPAIPPSLADTPCADLGVDGMLQHLNHLLRTTYTLDRHGLGYVWRKLKTGFAYDHTLDRPGLSSVLQSYIDRGFDFGLAYGHLRHWWFEDFTQLQKVMRGREVEDKARRERAIDGAYIVDRLLPPRRAWDLYSNRVLPWWVFRRWDGYRPKWDEMKGVDEISHSWVHPDDRQSVSTPINGYQWPVPIPKDTTLDRVRVELLNVGIEVVWLDVLCLWQDGFPEDDEARLREWELDVPTIGSVYQFPYFNTVVTYFNGLGRPFRIGNIDDERHWLNRAWTLQEFRKDGIIGGLVPGSFPPPMANYQVISDRNVVRFYHRLQAASNNSFGLLNVVLSVLAAMGPRHAAHVVDQVGGITHILTPGRIPKYIRGKESSAAEDAWNLLIPVMGDNNRADLFFLYPGRGNGKYAWCPSWDQVNGPLPPVPSFFLAGSLKYRDTVGRFECLGWLIERCQVQGFAKPGSRGRCRTGTLRVVHDGAEHSFTVAAHHQVPIPDGSYALVGDRSYHGPNVVVWAVGTLNSDKRFEKLSVLRTENKGDPDVMFNLGLIGQRDPNHARRREGRQLDKIDLL